MQPTVMQREILNVFFIIIWFKLAISCPSGWQQSQIDGNKCYLIVREELSWPEAEYSCQNKALNGHLVSVLSAFENTLINGYAASIGIFEQMWIGAKGVNDDSYFRWNDGNPMVYTNWMPGQPELNKLCVSIQVKGMGHWRTEPCSNTKNYYICEVYEGYATTTMSSNRPTDCLDLLHNGNSQSGVYTIYPAGIDPFFVYCDMTTDGGGWTVFQRRQDDAVVFWTRLWADYKNGFGNGLDQSMWLGLDRVHVLSTKDANVTLRIELWGNRCDGGPQCPNGGPDPNPNGHWFGEWLFQVENEANNYMLHVSNVTAGNLSSAEIDGLYLFNNNRNFTTPDRDNGNWQLGNCAGNPDFELGAWWSNECGNIFLNGKYNFSPQPNLGAYGFSFFHTYQRTFSIIPKRSEIKLRKRLAN